MNISKEAYIRNEDVRKSRLLYAMSRKKLHREQELALSTLTKRTV